MQPLTVQVTQAHIDEYVRRWDQLDFDGPFDDEAGIRAPALALRDALVERGVTADVRVHIYEEEPSRIFIGDYFCIAPDVVEDNEISGRGPYEFTLFAGDEAWATHVPKDVLATGFRAGAERRVYSAYVTGDNALHDDFESAVSVAAARRAEGMRGSVDRVTLQEIARETLDLETGPGGESA